MHLFSDFFFLEATRFRFIFASFKITSPSYRRISHTPAASKKPRYRTANAFLGTCKTSALQPNLLATQFGGPSAKRAARDRNSLFHLDTRSLLPPPSPPANGERARGSSIHLSKTFRKNSTMTTYSSTVGASPFGGEEQRFHL